jgi:amino acid adenylation domain-containing protein/thioester reductase-like protein
MTSHSTDTPIHAPLSWSQQGLWVLEQLDPEQCTYNLCWVLRIRGAVDATIVNQSMNALVKRHAILRTVFASGAGGPEQIVLPQLTIHIPLSSIEEMSPQAQLGELRHLFQEEASTPFDLKTGPLLRGTLLAAGENVHFLIMSMHHIIIDGWSMPILFNEFSKTYGRISQGVPPSTDVLPLQYHQFATQQINTVPEKNITDGFSYWKEQLSGALPRLELPTDFPRTAQQSQRGARYFFKIPGSVGERLVAACKKERVTMYMYLLTVFKVLLHRYCGEDDILVGSPTANRTQKESFSLLGFFVNTIVLRTDYGGNPSFHEALAREKRAVMDGMRYMAVPLGKVVEMLTMEQGRDGTQLFQTLFTLQNIPIPQGDDGGLQLTPVNIDHFHDPDYNWIQNDTGWSEFDLILELTNQQGGLVGAFEYKRELFKEETIARMQEHFLLLLDAALDDSAQPIASLNMLSAGENALLRQWNQTDTLYPNRDKTLARLFAEQVARTPRGVAVICGTESLSYMDLDQRSNQLANHLQSKGIEPDSLVAVTLERSLEMVIALLGVLKSGAAYVPIDPSYPEDRIAHMISSSKATLVITSTELTALVPAYNGEVICLDSDEQIARCPTTAPPNHASSEHLAYVIYTSGSTGLPKGVMIPNRAITNHMLWMQAECPMGEGDAVLQKTPFSFDASIWEFYAPLLTGGRLVMARPEGHQDLEYLIAVIQEQEITTLQLVPSLLGLLVEHGEFGSCLSLRRVFCGGEALSESVVAKFYELLPQAELYNLYGPSEATIDATFCLCEKDVPLVTIGRPVANCKAFILDRNGQQVPVGVPGELHLSGAGLARGYVHQPQLTAEKFIEADSALSGDTGQRLYKTGDRARFLPNGILQYLGRNDQQIKLRGFRVELGEIESVINASDLVRDSAVTAGGEGGALQYLVAYIVPETPGGDFTNVKEDLVRELAEILPEYMLPSIFMEMESLPLSPSGKIDRRALPQPEIKAHSRNISPQTDLEHEVVAIWQDLLGVQNMGMEDNFFDHGGHSLLAIQLVSRMRDTFGVEISLRDIFDKPYPANYVLLIEQNKKSAKQVHIPRLKPGEPLELSSVQQRLWFLDQMEGLSSVYNMPAAFHMEGELNVEALRQAFAALVQRQDSLRMAFPVKNGEAQLILLDDYSPLDIRDLRGLGTAERQVESVRMMNEHAQAPFLLAEGRLLRTTLLRLAEEEYVLLFTMHHIISDGWSIAILVTELGELYRSFSEGDDAVLAPLDIQYQDFAPWQKEWLKGSVLNTQREYWQEQLQNCPSLLELPADHVRPAVQSYNGAHYLGRFDTELHGDLLRLSRDKGISFFMTLFAGFSLLLSRLSSQEDICIGTPVANRGQAQLEQLIGFFVNTLVLRSRFNSQMSVDELLQQSKETCLGAFSHQEFPFEQLVDLLRPERSQGHAPLFQVMLVLQNSPMPEITLPGVTMTPMEQELSTAKFDITLSVEEQEQGVALDWEYNTEIFQESTIRRMSSQLELLLQGMCEAPEKRVWQLPILSREECSALRHWNATRQDFPVTKTLVDLFDTQLQCDPHAAAVQFKDTTLSYRQLDGMSNNLAHELTGLGVDNDTLVVVCLPRCPEMIIALMAILKAGGAYVPVDPGYPQERISHMLNDSCTPVIITAEHILAGLPEHGATSICLDSETLEERSDAPQRLNNPASLAYMIYTSGSTGTPKGVCCGHGGVINLFADFQKRAPLEQGTAHSFWTSLSFDVSVYEIFTPLTTGGCVHIVPDEIRGDGAAFCRWLGDSVIQSVYLPPFMLADFNNWLTDHPGESKLQRMLVGVEPIEEELLCGFMEKIPGLQVVNGYGPTEATICSTLYSVDPARSRTGRVPIGKAVQNSDLYVVDKNGQQVPMGVSGELYIGGVGLARGYWQRDDLTANSFISSPFFSQGGSPRLYRTGDLVRRLEDGNLEFTGRIDHQVKVRGFRIELGEIESLISQSGVVRDNLVVAQEDTMGSKRLVAYVATGNTENSGAISSRLRQLLAERLPEFMVPSVIVELEALPLTAGGKVDRKALPKPGRQAESVYVAPASPLEQTLVELWQDLLDLDHIGTTDNFFDLGGHSLLTVRLLARIQETVGQEIALNHFFASPTIGWLAETISNKGQTAAPDRCIGLEEEAVLPPEIRCEKSGTVPLRDAEHIFITGVTGFVGAFLLYELLRSTSAVIHCLVRASDPADGGERIRKGLQFYKLWDEADAPRIIAVPGDLARKGLGITAENMTRLGEIIDIIYHNGALVHHILPYSKLKAANVEGTVEVLKLACSTRCKAVHFISTLNVFSSSVGRQLCSENTATDGEEHLESKGYAASKWVSEKLVEMARERGIPTSIYRLGLVTAHSRSGACNGNDHMDLFIRSCVEMKAYPQTLPPVHLGPVDTLARAIVVLSARDDLQGKAFHLFNPGAVSANTILETYRTEDDMALQAIANEQWFTRVEADRDSDHALPIVPHLAMYKQVLGEYSRNDTEEKELYDCAASLSCLGEEGVRYPEISSTVINAYYAFLREKGLI